MAQEHPAVDATPAFVARRKMLADIAERERAQKRVAQRVDRNVAVRMRDDAVRMRDAHAADHYRVAGTECMDVNALAHAHQLILVNKNSARAISAGVVILMLSSAPSMSKGRCPCASIAAASSVAPP